MTRLLNTFTPFRCDCYAEEIPFYPTENCPRCYAAVTSVTTPNPNPVRGCGNDRDIIPLTATVEGGCNLAENVIIRARYNSRYFKPLRDASGKIVSDYFTHERPVIIGGFVSDLRELVALTNPNDPDSPEEVNTIDFDDARQIHFSMRFDPQAGIQYLEQPIEVYIGAASSNQSEARIAPYYDIEVQPGETILDLIPNQNSGSYRRFHIKGDLHFHFVYDPIPPGGYLEVNPPLGGSTGLTIYNFGNVSGVPRLDLIFDAGKAAVLDPDVRLILYDADLRGCDKMWRGIEHGPGAGTFMDKTRIEDAQFGLKVTGAGIFDIRSSEFRNNNFGIYADVPAGGVAPNMTLSSNVFESTEAGLRPAYAGQFPPPPAASGKGYTGIYFNNHSMASVTGTFAERSKFNNLHNGIVARNTNLTVQHSVFVNMTESKLPVGYPLNAAGNGIFCTNGSLRQYGFGDGAAAPISFNNCPHAVRATFSSVYVYDNRILNARYGIRSSSSLPRPYRIEHNRIQASEAGIALHQVSQAPGGASVSDNTVTMNGNPAGVGIRIGAIPFATHRGGRVQNNDVYLQNAAKGIEINQSNELTVNNNRVYLQNGALNYAGIQANGGNRNAVLCNYVEGTFNTLTSAGGPAAPNFVNQRAYQGMSAPATEWSCNDMFGTGLGMEFAGACDLSDIRGNYFNELNTGLQIGLAPSTGDAFTGPQTHRGNIWNDASLATGARYLGNPFQVFQSIFTVDDSYDLPGITSAYLPSTISGPPNWFIINSDNNTTYQCATQQPGYPGACTPLYFQEPGRESAESAVATGSLAGGAYQSGLVWTAQRHLYRRLMQEGNPYTGNTDIAGFMSTAGTAPVGAFGDWELSMANDYALNMQDSAFIALQEEQLGAAFDALHTLDAQLQDTALAASAADSLRALRAALLSSAQTLSAALDTRLANLDSLRQAYAPALLTDNTALPDSALFWYNEKQVNAVFVKWVSQKQAPAAADVLLLESIAQQCPLEGGEAVLSARNLLAAVDTSERFYNDPLLCQVAERSMAQQVFTPDEGIRFSVSPVPASDKIILNYALPDNAGQTCQFLLTDSKGRLALEVNLPAGEQQMTVNLPDMASGVYWYRVLHTGALKTQGRIIVLR